MAKIVAVYILAMKTESGTHGFLNCAIELVKLEICPWIFGFVSVFLCGLNSHAVAMALPLDIKG
ncbi:hypothetical protein D3C81_1092820 [compost metagenome]